MPVQFLAWRWVGWQALGRGVAGCGAWGGRLWCVGRQAGVGLSPCGTHRRASSPRSPRRRTSSRSAGVASGPSASGRRWRSPASCTWRRARPPASPYHGPGPCCPCRGPGSRRGPPRGSRGRAGHAWRRRAGQRSSRTRCYGRGRARRCRARSPPAAAPCPRPRRRQGRSLPACPRRRCPWQATLAGGAGRRARPTRSAGSRACRPRPARPGARPAAGSCSAARASRRGTRLRRRRPGVRSRPARGSACTWRRSRAR